MEMGFRGYTAPEAYEAIPPQAWIDPTQWGGTVDYTPVSTDDAPAFLEEEGGIAGLDEHVNARNSLGRGREFAVRGGVGLVGALGAHQAMKVAGLDTGTVAGEAVEGATAGVLTWGGAALTVGAEAAFLPEVAVFTGAYVAGGETAKVLDKTLEKAGVERETAEVTAAVGGGSVGGVTAALVGGVLAGGLAGISLPVLGAGAVVGGVLGGLGHFLTPLIS